MSEPVFEIIAHDGTSIEGGHRYRIWSDGRIEGFGDKAIVINRIPEYANAKLRRLGAPYDPTASAMGSALPINGY